MILTALVAATPLSAQEVAADDQPMSAIPWLTDSLTAPVALPVPAEPGISTNPGIEPITTTPIGQTVPDAVGLLPSAISGLDPKLWGPTPAAALAQAISAEAPEMVPALQEIRNRLLLAELDPPFDADASGVLFRARIDKLLDLGAMDEALSLLERAGPATPTLFPRYFDVALLTGTEDRACQYLQATPTLSPTYPVRIFCQARTGDWNGAVLTLTSARAIGLLDDVEFNLLARFLDPELFGEETIPPLPRQITPLIFLLLDAVDEPLPTTDLPRAFAFTDLQQTRGWKAQIEAAERLVRAGAIDPARLIALYTYQKPAASGGVWDRAAALQAVEAALNDPGTLSVALPRAWSLMQEAGLLIVLSNFVNGRIKPDGLTPEASDLTFKLAMLGPGYEAWALDHPAETPEQSVLAAIARGQSTADTTSPKATAALAAFAATDMPQPLKSLTDADRKGEAILSAIRMVTMGAAGEFDEFADGLAGLRALGLESTARRAALQSLILDQRG